MAQQLRAQDQEVALLALIDIHARQHEYEQVLLDLDEQLDDEVKAAQVDFDVSNLIEVHKANARALYDYRPAATADRLILFSASDREGLSEDPTLGWSRLSSQHVEVEVIPGTHESIMSKPNVEVLATKLRSYLDSASLR